MEIFVTGNLKVLTSRFFEVIGNNNKIIACGKSKLKDLNIPNVTPYDYKEADGASIGEKIARLFQTYNFKSVILFSMLLDGEVNTFGEFDILENSLNHCKNSNVSDVIYITSNEFLSGNHENNKNGRYILTQACDELCRNYVRDYAMNITVIRIPYLYNMENFDSQLGKWMTTCEKEKRIFFSGMPNTEVDFLREEDLANLIIRVRDEPYSGYLELNISGNNRINYQNLSELISEGREDIQYKYQDSNQAIPQFYMDNCARELYGWFPLGVLDNDVKELINRFRNIQKMKPRGFYIQKLKSKSIHILNEFVELLLLFACSFYLDGLTLGNNQLHFLDFRMLFVVIIGMMRGMRLGMVASLFAYAGYLYKEFSILEWEIIFYNIQNWLPLGVYFLVGAIAGYASDRKQDAIKYLQEEQKILEDKYIFVNELYAEALKSKSKYVNQIINYKDSFGRVYSAVKRLDSTIPEQIFYEAVNVLEDILENHSIAIYTIAGNLEFARLEVCSMSMNLVLRKSLRLFDYPEMIKALDHNETWINVECIPDYPAYAMGIFCDEKIVGIIMLMHAEDQQMNLEFMNKFNICSGLVKGSLIRAIERKELLEKDTMITNTRIYKKDAFRQILNIKKQMKEKEVSDYVLLKLDEYDMALTDLSDKVSRQVRNNDIIGQGEDGNIYLLLSQANNINFGYIEKRLENQGVHCALVNG